MVRNWRHAGVRSLGAVLAVFALIVAGLFATTGAEADAAGKKSRNNQQVKDLATGCFAASIDQVGRGNLDTGVAMFDDCLSDDYVFEFQAFPGGPVLVCPGEGCPVQEYSSLGEMRALFAHNFFVAAGYQATQHQILNIEVDRHKKTATASSYIQANHFLPDNSVDIAWNDYFFDAVREGGTWKMSKETIVGTSFLNFQGRVVGGDGDDGDDGDKDGPLTVMTDVGMRNTLQDAGEPEVAYPALFGLADDAFDQFAWISNEDSEFPNALGVKDTPVGDINGLYDIDLTEDSINFEVIAAPDDPFWKDVFGLFPEGKFDRYYFTFEVPHNVTGFTSDNPNLNVRIDSENVLVVELSGGYDLQSGVSFSVNLES